MGPTLAELATAVSGMAGCRLAVRRYPLNTSTTALRRRLTGVLAATALAGTVTAALAAPSVTASPDPCAASEVARTVGSVAKSAGDYLDSHPETNRAMTSVLQQPGGPQSVGTLKAYFDANPKVQRDLQTVAEPLSGVATQCRLPISLPQVLGLMQTAQGQGGLGTQLLPGAPGAVPPVSGGDAPSAPSAGPVTAPPVARVARAG
jgi:hemophore